MEIFLFSNLIQLCDFEINKNFRFITITTNFQINDCFFKRITSFDGDGGIIFCFDSLINMSIFNSIFNNCSCNGNGGAIYFDCSTVFGSCSELNKVCAYQCYTNNDNYGQFGYIRSYNLNNNTNILVSISKSNSIIAGYASFSIWYGFQNLISYNSSNNFNKWYSGISINTPNSFNSNFCTFIDNFNSIYISVFLYGGNNNLLLNSQMIRNNSPTYGDFTIWNNGIYKMDECLFFNNSNILFYVQSGSLNLNFCKIIHNSITTNGNIIFSNINNIISNTLNIIYFNPKNCNNYIYFSNSMKNSIFKFSILFIKFLFYFFFLCRKVKVQKDY